MKLAILAVAIGLTLAIPRAWAASDSGPKYSPAYERCADKSDGVTVALEVCYAEEIHRQDAALNETYKKLMAALDPKRKAALQRAERAWMAFRDAECAYQSAADSETTGGSLDVDQCDLDQTAIRLKSLRDDLSTEKEYGDN